MFHPVFFLLITVFGKTWSITLLTFDVDGTLVKGTGTADVSAHSKAFAYGCGKILSPDGKPTTPVAQVLERKKYHGSTDGLILLRLAKASLGVEPEEAVPKLKDMMDSMYHYISKLDDATIADGIDVLPGVLENLKYLSQMKRNVMCGLVTGNVEGIARRKMNAVGILQTQAFAPPAFDQMEWEGTEDLAFLGGFGSDYCSGNINDDKYNYLDRSKQIAIAAKRCQDSLNKKNQTLKRIVHVGDAPADVLAAKVFFQNNRNRDICIGMVAVATGSYSVDELKQHTGERIEGHWEPFVLEKGMADPDFLEMCGVR